MPDAKIAVLLTQAKLQLMSEQYEQANATLNLLHSLVPKHPHVLKLMLSLYKKLNDCNELSKILPTLKHNKIISEAEYNLLEKKIYLSLIESAKSNEDKGRLLKIWDQLSKSLKKDYELVSFYVRKLIFYNENEHAEYILRLSIKKNWHEGFVKLYGQLNNLDLNKQLRFVESFKRSYSNSPALYQTLGILSKKLQLWGKSKDYLEYSSEIEPSEKTFFELGELYRLLNDETAACDRFEKGLRLAMADKQLDTKQTLLISHDS